MRILALAGGYPYAGHLFAGTFNEKCVAALKALCEYVEVLVPRPYAPRCLSLVPRWRAYAALKRYELRNGVSVHRPAIPVIPGIGVAPPGFWICRRKARELHGRVTFDAIVSFDLLGAGTLAWRLGRDLGIPATGWAFGDDVRFPLSSRLGREIRQALMNLDLVFYQSRELFGLAAKLLGMEADAMETRHQVLPHGIPDPPQIRRVSVRDNLRFDWNIGDDQILVLSIGRIVRAKGVFELLEAIARVRSQNPRVVCVMVGSTPAFDETSTVARVIQDDVRLRDHVRLLPACKPAEIWDYYCAADIFAFASHQEGMPNSLLEAMAMGLPAAAFAIPPVREIEAGSGCVMMSRPGDIDEFSSKILQLAGAPKERERIAAQGRQAIRQRFFIRDNMAEATRLLGVVVEDHARYRYGVQRLPRPRAELH